MQRTPCPRTLTFCALANCFFWIPESRVEVFMAVEDTPMKMVNLRTVMFFHKTSPTGLQTKKGVSQKGGSPTASTHTNMVPFLLLKSQHF